MRRVRSATIGAIVIALLIGSAMAVVAQEAALPVEFTGHIECGPAVRISETEPAWQQPATMSDPRLEGTYYHSEARQTFGATLPATAAAAGTLRIENDEGAWQGSMTYAYLSDGTGTTASTVLVGEGAYEGLSAIWEERFLLPGCGAADVRGLIIEGEVPAAPEPYIGE